MEGGLRYKLLLYIIVLFQVHKDVDLPKNGDNLFMMSKTNWRVNKKCFQVFFRATVVYLLVAISIGCYFLAKKDSNQYGDLLDFNVANVTGSSLFGK